MHKRPEVKLLPLDTEIERTLRNLEKLRSTEEASMVEQREGNQNISIIVTDRPQQRQNYGRFLEAKHRGRVFNNKGSHQ